MQVNPEVESVEAVLRLHVSAGMTYRDLRETNSFATYRRLTGHEFVPDGPTAAEQAEDAAEILRLHRAGGMSVDKLKATPSWTTFHRISGSEFQF
jgi:hypothetical protein